MSEEVSKEDRLLAALCYPFWFLAFLILNLSPVLKRQRFVRYHAFQAFFLGLGIWAGLVVVNTAAVFVGRFLWPIGLLMYPLMKLVGLACLLLTAYCAFRAWKGDYFALPYVTEFARPFVEESLVPTMEPVEPEPPAVATQDLVERIPTVEEAAPEAPPKRRRKGGDGA